MSFTVAQVAEHLAINADHVRDLIRTGELPAFNVGGTKRPTYRISPDALAGFEARRTVRQPEKPIRQRKAAPTFRRWI